MIAKDFMTTDVKTCPKDATIEQAACTMWEGGFSALPVVDADHKLVGILTESDFVGKDVEIPHALGSIKGILGEMYLSYGDFEDIFKRVKCKPVTEVMSDQPVAVEADMSLNHILNLMSNRNLKRLPVVDGGKVVGIITRKDILNAFLKVSGSK